MLLEAFGHETSLDRHFGAELEPGCNDSWRQWRVAVWVQCNNVADEPAEQEATLAARTKPSTTSLQNGLMHSSWDQLLIATHRKG